MQTATIKRSSSGLAIAEQIANLLENQFRFGKWGFGLDSILDLLPIGGDVIVMLLSLSLLAIGLQMGVSRTDLLRMAGNILLAFLIGLVPVIGDVAYLAFRPNMRNLEILRKSSLS